MYRTLTYLGLFVASVLLQVFLFDNLSISTYFNPLIYIAFIVLLPVDTLPIVLLGAGLAMGVTMDATMGAAGVNTISTLAIAFLRPTLAGILCGRDNIRDGGVPSPQRFGIRPFIHYLVAIVLIHHLIFFSLESLSLTHLLHTAIRIVVSSAASILFIWFIAKIFTAKLPLRV